MNFNIIAYTDNYETKVLDLLSSLFKKRYTSEYLRSNLSNRYILLEGNTVVGFLEFLTVLDSGEILMIAVDRKYQGMGLGKMLIEFALRMMKDKGVKEVYLDVFVENDKAVNFYRNYGFEVVLIRRGYYSDGGDAFLMRKRI
ncbi:MAG: ribosomal protein S18-alanine N-acetyltransferase [Hydrogenothermaceae bacterium]|nr:ribosomal protein S18-alanine N-acetyltransferase [Hydrogenothermaceae bacterium]